MEDDYFSLQSILADNHVSQSQAVYSRIGGWLAHMVVVNLKILL